MDRLDALSVREDKNGKKYWTRLGVAFKAKNGDGYNVMLDCVPAPTDGQYKIYLMAPREDNRQAPAQPGGSSGGGRQVGADDDSSIPF